MTEPDVAALAVGRPVRVQLSRKKGWRMPPNTVSVARPGRWGNPFKVDRENGFNSAGAVHAFKVRTHGILAISAIDLSPLRGKNLACWCPLDQLCHADVLLELANREDQHLLSAQQSERGE